MLLFSTPSYIIFLQNLTNSTNAAKKTQKKQYKIKEAKIKLKIGKTKATNRRSKSACCVMQ